MITIAYRKTDVDGQGDGTSAGPLSEIGALARAGYHTGCRQPGRCGFVTSDPNELWR
jgi:hypothetical protein